MTRRTPAGRCIAASPGAILALLCLLGGCGALSRDVRAHRNLARAQSPEQLELLRGRDPRLAPAWLLSAHRAETPEERLAIVEQGLGFLPGQPDLVLARISLLRDAGRHADQVEAAAEALGSGPAPGLVSYLHALRVEGFLGLDDPTAAGAEAVALGADEDASTLLLAEVHARVALEQEFLGQPDEADRSLDASLALSSYVGPGVLRETVLTSPAKAAAARGLAARAEARHPRQPDLDLFQVWDHMRSDRLDEAEALLGDLPQPLPRRLALEIDPLRARIRLLQGRVEEGLAILLPRLERWPEDRRALTVLIESWEQQQRPSRDRLRSILTSVRARVRTPSLARELDRVLASLDATAPAAP